MKRMPLLLPLLLFSVVSNNLSIYLASQQDLQATLQSLSDDLFASFSIQDQACLNALAHLQVWLVVDFKLSLECVLVYSPLAQNLLLDYIFG